MRTILFFILLMSTLGCQSIFDRKHLLDPTMDLGQKDSLLLEKHKNQSRSLYEKAGSGSGAANLAVCPTCG